MTTVERGRSVRSATSSGPAPSPGSAACPHRSAHDAAAFALREYDLPAIPTLPRRSPAEGMIAQAVVGIGGAALGQYGSVAVDVESLDPDAPVHTDLAEPRLHVVAARSSPPPWRLACVSDQVAVRRAGDARRRCSPGSACPPTACSPSPPVPSVPTSWRWPRPSPRRCRRHRNWCGWTSRGSAS